MEPITLVTTAVALATPYLIKTGEKLAEGVGESIWEWLKKPFTKDEIENLPTNLNSAQELESLKLAILRKVESDATYRENLENAVVKGEQILNTNQQQNVNNHAAVEKQINIATNTGNIQM